MCGKNPFRYIVAFSNESPVNSGYNENQRKCDFHYQPLIQEEPTMKRIDLENHFYPAIVIEQLQTRSQPPVYFPEDDLIRWNGSVTMPQGRLLPALLETGDKRIAMMDRLGIDLAVISCSPGAEQLDSDVIAETCRAVNDSLYALTQKYPGRYLGSALLPVTDVAAACAELERCVKELGFVCWHTHSNYGDSSPDDMRYRPIFRKAAELGVYVYLHPQLPVDARVQDLGFSVAGPGLGFTVDTMTTLTRMVVTGLFDELPELKVVLGHLGEALPFLMERMDNRFRFIPNPQLKSKRDFSDYFRNNIYVTTSGNMSPQAFRCTQDVLGIDRIMFGSDHPFEDAGDMVNFLDKLPLPDEEREKVYEKNARMLLGM